MNYSLRTLLIVAAGFAVVCASMAYPTPIIGDLFYTFGLILIAYAVIAAIYCRGTRRAYWIGFIVLFAGYYSHSVWPGEIRGTFALIQGSGGMRFPAQGLVTSRLLSIAYEGLHPDSFRGSVFASPRSGRLTSQDEKAGKYIAFMTTGHTAIAMLLGIAGGFVAQTIAARTPQPVKRPLEKILSEMDM
jgi:hypothetical protein